MPLFVLSSLTCHRFIITSITVSSKALCDVFCANNFYARVGGITVTELNLLEREFLAMIEWRLMVSKSHHPSLVPFPPLVLHTPSLSQFAYRGFIREQGTFLILVPFLSIMTVQSRHPPRILRQFSTHTQRWDLLHRRIRTITASSLGR